MAAEHTGPAAPFPTPPPFYKHFTKQNIARLRKLLSATVTSGDEEGSKHDVDMPSLPLELRYLIPPAPPSRDATYTSFGNDMTLETAEPTLADSNIEQLFPSHPAVRLNPQPHLIALARSMLTTFLSLTGILSQDPLLQEEKSLDLQAIVFNMHDLINQYRPHQARETLILMMEDRLEQVRKEIQAIDEGKSKVMKLLQDMTANGEAQTPQLPETSMNGIFQVAEDDSRHRARQRAAWAAMDNAIE